MGTHRVVRRVDPALAVSDYAEGSRSTATARLKVVFEFDVRLGAAEVPVPDSLIGIGQSEEVKTGGGATLTFTVKDIEAARALPRGRGRPLRRRDLAGRGHGAADDDLRPRRNALMLAQQLRRSNGVPNGRRYRSEVTRSSAEAPSIASRRVTDSDATALAVDHAPGHSRHPTTSARWPTWSPPQRGDPPDFRPQSAMVHAIRHGLHWPVAEGGADAGPRLAV